MTKDPTDHAMVISMNDIAHFLGQKTVAEYVESREILKLLADCSVDYIQGFYVTEPIPGPIASGARGEQQHWQDEIETVS